MPEQFGYPLPEAIAPKPHYVGPIVRRPDPEGIAAVRARYATDEVALGNRKALEILVGLAQS